MEASRFNVDADDLRKYDWQDRLAAHSPKDCQTYYQVFGRSSAQYENIGDEIGERVYALLDAIASFCTNFDSDLHPYFPRLQNPDGTRSILPEDLADRDLKALEDILPEIEDFEYKARVADVLWIRRRNFKAAQIAIQSFLDAANLHKTADLWPPYVDRLTRAAVIAGKKGFEKELPKVVETIEGAISEFKDIEASGLLCARLMGIMLDINVGNPAEYALLSEKLARLFHGSGEWHFSENYWTFAERCHRKNKDEASLQLSILEAAECLISRAQTEASLDPPRMGQAANSMGKALEMLRRAKADQNRTNEIHRDFLALQKVALTELRPIGFDPYSIPGLKEQEDQIQQGAIAHVRGFSFEEAVTRFALIKEPTNVAQLIESERSNIEGSIWDKIFGSNRLDRDGKVADVMPPLGIGEDDQNPAALRKKLTQSASMCSWPYAVEWWIEPARRVMVEEHPICFSDLAFLVSNNPFIREGHEGIYLKGIQAGFFGDWLVAMHLLVPQIEESIRMVLQQRGIVTSTLKQGIQQERDINDLLHEDEAKNIFGEDMLFDLRGILIERFGSNMRNKLAHGLMSEGDFYRAESVYLWWLVIRLCWTGFIIAHANDQPRKEE